MRIIAMLASLTLVGSAQAAPTHLGLGERQTSVVLVRGRQVCIHRRRTSYMYCQPDIRTDR